MSAIRNLVTDLIDRRLWPVAVALLGALVAVPVMLGGGAKAPAGAPAAPLAATPAAPTAQGAISVSTPPTKRINRPGPVRNPFVQHKIKPPVVATTPTAGPVSSAPTTPVTSAPSVPIGGLPAPPLAPQLPGSGGGRRDGAVPNVWRVNLRFGEAGSQKIRHDVPRLTPLPSSTDPFFIFLGVLADGKTAVFLVSSDATATGDGKCKPTPDQCDTVELRAGDTEFFDVTDGNAGVTQYELDLLKVFHNKPATGAAAARAAKLVSRDGRNVIKELKAEGDPTGSGRYIWSAKRGVLVRRHGLKVAAAATSSSTGQSPGAQMSGVFGVTWTG